MQLECVDCHVKGVLGAEQRAVVALPLVFLRTTCNISPNAGINTGSTKACVLSFHGHAVE
jgi:hypothetical protein